MAKSQVQFTKDNEYYTPKDFVARFGQFDYDPATTKEKAKVCKNLFIVIDKFKNI